MKAIHNSEFHQDEKMKAYFRTLIELDLDTMDGFTPETFGSAEYWYNLCKNRNKTWCTFVDDQDQACAYFHLQAVKPHIVEQVKLGTFDERNLIEDDLYTLDQPGEYTAYFIGIAIREDMRSAKHMLLLFKTLFHYLEDLSQEGIYFKEWYADAVTPEGAVMCEKFNMYPIVEHHDTGTVYYTNNFRLPKGTSTNNCLNLKAYYGD